MKVYVLTTGEYSDYHIIYVTLDKEKAENFVNDTNKYVDKNWGYNIVNLEEYDTDVLDFVYDNDKIWYAKKLQGEIEISFDEEVIGNPYFDEKVNVVKDSWDGGLCVYVSAKDSDHAFKIACDLFAQYEAIKEGIA